MLKRYGTGPLVAVLATVIIWSTTFAGLVAALKHFSVGHLLFLRWTLTALGFLAYAIATRMRLPRLRDVPAIALVGLLGFAVYQMLLVTGQQGVSASAAGFLVNMNPVFATLIAVALRRESASAFTWSGIAVCMAGLLLMASAHGAMGGSPTSALVVALAALSFACYTTLSKPLFARYTPIELTTYAVVAGSLPFVVFAPGSWHSLVTATPADLATVVFLAALPGGISYVLWSRAVAELPPGVASRFLYLVPVIGVPVAWMWVGEVPHALTIVGGLVTTAGVALSTVRSLPAWMTPRSATAEKVPASPQAEAPLATDAA